MSITENEVKQLEVTADYEEFSFIDPEQEIKFLSDRNAPAPSAYKVSMKRGHIAGVGASVSGAGAWVRVDGSMSFTLRQLEKSSTYNKMVKKYSISGGVRGFWSWIGFGANASNHKTEIKETLKELTNSTKVKGTVNVDIMVTGLYVNVQVDASAYVQVLQITDSQGNNMTVFSNSGPSADVGAQDSNGNRLPTDDNNSTISI